MKINLSCLLLSIALSSTLYAGDLTIKGSDTMLIMNQRLAQEYMKKNPTANIQVSGGGSGVGIAALRNNTTDIAAASRLIKPKESQDFLLNTGIDPIRYSVALDGVAMFVNQSNSVREVTLDQLGKIFHGDYTNWKEVGGPNLAITVYSRENTSGTYSFVKDVVLKEADYTPRAQTLAGTAQVYDAVANDPKGIGYGGIGYNKGVKLLRVKVDETSIAYLPTEENVDKKLYPLSRSLNFYLNPRSENPDAEKFIAWVRSPAGQRVVAQTYFAIPGILKPIASTPPPAPEPKMEQKIEPKMDSPMETSHLATTYSPPPPMSAPLMDKPLTSMSPSPAAPVSQFTSAPMSTPVSSFGASTPTAEVTNLVERENKVVVREENLAQRESALAQRETILAEREYKETQREQQQFQISPK